MPISANLGLAGLVSLWALGGSMAAPQVQTRTQTLDYDGYMHALSYGNAERVGDVSSSGDVVFRVKGVPVDKLPRCQEDLDISTLDNLYVLLSIAELGHEAAQQGKWGDFVYLYSAFGMNGHFDYARATSKQMADALLGAVTKPDGSAIDEALIDEYVKTSSTPALAAAFNALRMTHVPAGLTAQWTKETCKASHQALREACSILINNVRGNASIKRGAPRSICKAGCCISWNIDAVFEVRNLASAADECMSLCPGNSVSCEIYGVDLQGATVNQCLSNRAFGCG
ncbi:hypothetical protein E4U42_005271 [Claviceps africana]|uniref:WD-like domain-containing protein n=1 Tax=Claviceps africana TaxID=83212 RepID=A0A8K0NPP4_9HYPO|nr:hypothetical protein E4U42_005271 [Claviceps africana]